MQHILSTMRRAITDYNMINDGDKIAVGVSGGKDSLCLLCALNAYKRFSPQKFDIVGITINMGFKNSSKVQLEAMHNYIEDLGVQHIVLDTDIAEIIFNVRKEKSPCSLCSKMRRGALNNEAIKQGCNKLALGHHADDVLCTMLLSLMYEGRFSTFQPASYMDRSNITLIRPFIYTDEKDIIGVCRKLNMPLYDNPCPENKQTQREYMAGLVKKLTKEIPFARERMLGAIYHPERNNLWSIPKDK